MQTIINKLVDEGLLLFIGDVPEFTEKYQAFNNWYKRNKNNLDVEEESKTVYDFEEFIESWNNMFPTARTTGHRNTRSSKHDVSKRMRDFIKKYNYSPDIINRATVNYLEREKKEGYKYAKESAYFIEKKGDPSKLLSECEQVVTDLREGKITLDSRQIVQEDFSWTKLA